MKKMYKVMLLVLCAVLLVAGSVWGTLTYLKDTKTVTNTFTVGKVSITLDEAKTDEYGVILTGNDAARVTANTYKLIPGHTYSKDPKITVDKDSEACWLFVKVNENLGAWTAEGKTFSDYLNYSVINGENGWTALDGVSGVYYRKVADSNEDQSFDILAGNTVTVLNSVKKADIDKLYVAGAVQPTLTFTAYAIQQEGFADAAAAWTGIVDIWNPAQNA